MKAPETKSKRKIFFLGSGRIYFSRGQERRFYFYSTVVMAALGLLYYTGILN